VTTYNTTTLTVVDAVTYEPFGPLNGLTFGNSLTLSRAFDTQYRLTAQTTGAIQDLAFTHDAAGNIDAIEDGVFRLKSVGEIDLNAEPGDRQAPRRQR
jgi:YD repeat-containing protein